MKILYQIARAEAGATNKEGIKNVVYVILNRVKSEQFPNTVKGVVYQKNQFSPVLTGSINRVQVTDFVRECVDEAVADYEKSNKARNALYFSSGRVTFSWATYIFTDSVGHKFFK